MRGRIKVLGGETDDEHLSKSINKIQMKSFQAMISGMKENLGEFTQDSVEQAPARWSEQASD